MTPALAWTLAAAVGTILSAFNLWQRLRDLWAIRHVRNGRRFIQVGHVRRSALRLTAQLTWTLIGLVALLVPGQFGGLLVAGLIGSVVIITLNELLDLLQARRENEIFGPPPPDVAVR